MHNSVLPPIVNSIRHVFVGGLDLVLPPRCLSCREVIAEQGRVCAPCWNQIPFLAGPVCRSCARPLEASASDEPICERCAFEPPNWELAVAALRYEGLARRMILRFKHGDRIEGSELLAEWLAMATRPIVSPETLILPIPLHRWRLLARGYNQSTLLAKPLAKRLNCHFEPHLLQRRVATGSQQGLNAKERLSNIRTEHFAIEAPDRIFGRPILLLDDVLTTGATLSAATAAVCNAGAARVDVAALARVVRDE